MDDLKRLAWQWFGSETAGLQHYGPFSMLLERTALRVDLPLVMEIIDSEEEMNGSCSCSMK
jgi:PII-like signaling protein